MSEATKPNPPFINNIVGNIGPTNLDCSKAGTGVWLVKVPKYLAKKWNEAPDNTDVGVIRITQSKATPKPVQEVVFHLNESLGKTVSIKIGNKTIEEIVPVEHKFVMTPLGSQAVYVLKQTEDGPKENLNVCGKVMQRAECTPVQNDTNYIQLKRETMKSFTEPKRQIKMANDFIQRTHFLPKSVHYDQKVEKKDKTKKLRKDKEKVLDLLFNAFAKHQFYNIKDLVKLTQQPTTYLKDILHEICKYNGKGSHKNTWELKEEYKQSGTTEESKKKAAASLSKEGEKSAISKEDFMDDDDDDDFDEDDMDDDDDDMVEQM